MLDLTKRLDGANYVLWGGREGYETLLNTDVRREEQQFARFLHLVAEHKHRIGFEGLLLIEPKPQEPTKHQYDYDSATVHGFLARHGLEGEYKVNIEANHATLAGHSFHHEIAYAVANDIFGSIDANRGDYQNGWDTDQFPNSVDELALALYEILAPAASRRAASTSTPSCAARASIGPTCSTATSAASTRSRRPRLWPPRWSRTASWPGAGTSDTRVGVATLAATCSRDGRRFRISRSGWSAMGSSRGRSRVGRSCSRTW